MEGLRGALRGLTCGARGLVAGPLWGQPHALFTLQVVPQYLGEATLAGACKDAEAVKSSKLAWVQKAQRFLGKRSREDDGGVTLVALAPPAKKHRGKSALWGVTLNSILEKTTGRSLDFWRIPEGTAMPPAEWPCLGVAPDQGADGMCFVHYMFSQRVNVQVWFDPSHGVWRDQECAMRSVGLSGFALLMCVAFNLSSGPCDSQSRYAQLLESSREYLAHMAVSCPLLQTFSAEMCKNYDIDAGSFSTNAELTDAIKEAMASDRNRETKALW